MTAALMHSNSPLARMQQKTRMNLPAARRQLSPADQARLRSILENKYECMHHESFELPEAEATQQIFDDAPEVPKPDTAWYHPVMDVANDDINNRNNGSVLLTAKQEAALFLQFNYCRHRVNEYKSKLLESESVDQDLSPELARACLAWHDRAETYRTQIADTNLALVLAMAKRTPVKEVDFTDLISEGNMALLRAIDKFDVSRGFKFSTYACRAILKAFSRHGIKHTKYKKLFPTDFDPALERSNHTEIKNRTHELDCASEAKRAVEENLCDLSEIEIGVLSYRFNLDNDPELDANPLTLEQVGKRIGVTKERVRQIQNKALVKIRNHLEGDFMR